jgi:hypothetical protein
MARRKSKGLGDTVEKIIKATGLDTFVEGKDCGCDKRKEYLNKIFPYRFKARCLTEQEYIDYGTFREVRTLNLKHEQIVYLCDLYASVFNKQKWYPCVGCNQVQEMLSIIDKLDKVYESYEKNIISIA